MSRGRLHARTRTARWPAGLATLVVGALIAAPLVGMAISKADEPTIITVDTLDDEDAMPCQPDGLNDCTLEQAIAVANSDSLNQAPFKIVFDVQAIWGDQSDPGTIPIAAGFEIESVGLIIDGDNSDGVPITIAPADASTFAPNDDNEAIGIYADDVTLTDLTVTGFANPETQDATPWTGVGVRSGKNGAKLIRTAVYGNDVNLVLNGSGSERANYDQAVPTNLVSGPSGVNVHTPLENEAWHGSELGFPSYTVQVYRCEQGDAVDDIPTEGREWVGTVEHVPPTAYVNVPVGPISEGDRFSATVTDEDTRSTSEFSYCSDPAEQDYAAANLETTCHEGLPCTVAVPEEAENPFTVTASGGEGSPTLFADFDGGLAPSCEGSDDDPSESGLDPHWVRFGFTDPAAGETWTKTVTLPSSEEMSKSEAEAALPETLVCFSAPYVFPTREGFPLLGGPDEGVVDYYGVLPDCREDGSTGPGNQNSADPDMPYGPYGPYGPYEGIGPFGAFGPYGPGTGAPSGPAPSPENPGGEPEGPCVSLREVVPSHDQFVTQISFRVPAGDQDPQGRSCRKKKPRKC